MSTLKIGLIGGSGLGQVLLAGHEGKRHELETPFGRPSDAIIETTIAGLDVFILNRHGPGHTIPPSAIPFRANIYALKQLGVTHVIASGAVGSLRDEFKPRDLVIPDQVIDKTIHRMGTFFEKAAVHVEMAEPFCPMLREVLLEAGSRLSEGEQPIRTHGRGCYVCMEGPAFSTRAESLMHRLWGGDLIGMTCMPEAKLAKEAEISYALVALVTDYDCWKKRPAEQQQAEPAELMKEIVGHLQVATGNAMRLIKDALELAASKQDDLMKSPSLQALQLAIWSDKGKIPADEVLRLKPIWGRYFEPQP
jgi:5'-methylthioadenosine phosphorylase